MIFLVFLAFFFLFALPANAVDPVVTLNYPTLSKAKPKTIDWLKTIRQKVKPLTHSRGNRWPLIMMKGTGYEPLSSDSINMLLKRGITQHLKVDPSMIPAALKLQDMGSPVILMEGSHGAWPYTLEKDKTQWAHQYPTNQKVPPHWRDTPSPTRFQGWHLAAQKLRTILGEFRKKGVLVDAVWLDYEGEPSQANYYAATLSPSTRKLLPDEAVLNETSFRHYTRQLWVQLLSAYMAAPIREIFPNVSVSNWVVTLSSPQKPLLDWLNRTHPPLGPSLFTATTPIAYGIDTTFLVLWRKKYPLDQEHVDQLYMHVLLRQVSVDSENRQQMAPYLKAFPWVARWVPDHPNKKVPVMSRKRYREALIHLWLRGIDGMQVFNPAYPGQEDMAVFEVMDTVAIYDEMLAYRTFLDKGSVMNFEFPKVQDEGPVWSGLRLGDKAIVRVFWQGSQSKPLKIEPWEGYQVELKHSDQGVTYYLERTPNHTVKVSKVGGS